MNAEAIRVACPHCAGHIEFDPDYLGAETTCPHCAANVLLAEAEAPRPLASAAPRRSWKPMVVGVAAAGGLILLAYGLHRALLLAQRFPALPGAIGSVFVAIGLTVAALLLYFLPALVARKKRNGSAILVFNFFLGWTFIGWVLALVWACMVDKDEPR